MKFYQSLVGEKSSLPVDIYLFYHFKNLELEFFYERLGLRFDF